MCLVEAGTVYLKKKDTLTWENHGLSKRQWISSLHGPSAQKMAAFMSLRVGL